jgi:hypothetical protein
MAKISKDEIVAAAKQVSCGIGIADSQWATSPKQRKCPELLCFPIEGRRPHRSRDERVCGIVIWCVRGDELVQASPDTKDLLESSYRFATLVTTKAAAATRASSHENLQVPFGKQLLESTQHGHAGNPRLGGEVSG